MYCGRRRAFRHFTVFICVQPASGFQKPRLITLPYSRDFPGNSLSTVRKLRLVAAKSASAASSPQSTLRSPLASLAACFPRLAAPLPKNLAYAMFSGALFDIVVAPRPQLRRNSCSITLPSSLLFPGNSLLTARTLLRCRFPCCGGGSPRCPLVRASPKSGRRPFPSPSLTSAP